MRSQRPLLGVPAAAQTSSYCSKSRSTYVASGWACPTGGTPPMAKPVNWRTWSALARVIGCPTSAPTLSHVDAIGPGGQHQDGLLAGHEDQRLDDLLDARRRSPRRRRLPWPCSRRTRASARPSRPCAASAARTRSTDDGRAAVGLRTWIWKRASHGHESTRGRRAETLHSVAWLGSRSISSSARPKPSCAHAAWREWQFLSCAAAGARPDQPVRVRISPTLRQLTCGPTCRPPRPTMPASTQRCRRCSPPPSSKAARATSPAASTRVQASHTIDFEGQRHARGATRPRAGRCCPRCRADTRSRKAGVGVRSRAEPNPGALAGGAARAARAAGLRRLARVLVRRCAACDLAQVAKLANSVLQATATCTATACAIYLTSSTCRIDDAVDLGPRLGIPRAALRRDLPRTHAHAVVDSRRCATWASS